MAVIGPLAALALLLVLLLGALYHHLRKRHEQHHTLIQWFRWLAGHPWDGVPRTNATWTRHATRTLTVTGHARAFWHRPGYWRFSSRTGRVMIALVIGYGLLVDRHATLVMLPVGLAALLTWNGFRGWGALMNYRFHREWVLPTHLAIAPLVGHPLSIPPKQWLDIGKDRATSTLLLPPGFTATELEKERIVTAVAGKLGMESPQPRWSPEGAEPKLHLVHKPAPPKLVGLTDIRRAIAEAGPHELVFGMGRGGQIVKVSVEQDSPHMGASIPSGGGKSVLAKLVGGQWLCKGGLVCVLDIKMISHPWARNLPNVAYGATRPLIHDILIYLAAELDRRNTVAYAATDYEGEVHANVGPPLLVLCEELNMTMSRLRSYWESIRGPNDPRRSPAIDAFETLAFAGRQVRIHLLMIGQRLSANAVSSGDVRENMGIRMLAGDTKKRTWEMLAPEHAMPAAVKALGRIQVVTGDAVRECQVARLSGAEARQLAISGIEIAAFPQDVPGVTAASHGLVRNGGPGQAGNPATTAGLPITPRGDVTLRAACIVLPIEHGTLKMWRWRYADFPRPTGKDGNADLFSLEALSAFMESRMVKS